MWTWLLIPERPSATDPAVGLLRSLGQPPVLLNQPVGYLDVPADGRPRLSFRSQVERTAFFAHAASKVRTADFCLTLATNPAEELQRVGGTTFTVPGGAFRLDRVGPEEELPYAPRLLRLTVGAGARRPGRVSVFRGRPTNRRPLFLDPRPVRTSAAQDAAYETAFTDWGAFLHGTAVIILPPVRDGFAADSYFAAPDRDVRAAFRAAAPEYAAGQEPLILRAARATDHPAVRDWLLEGTALGVTRGDGAASRLLLRVPAGTGAGVSGYRRAFLHSPSAVPGVHVEGTRAVAAALRGDLLAVVDAVRPSPAAAVGEPSDLWRIDDLLAGRIYDFRDPGSWRMLTDAAARLPATARRAIEQHVLLPTANGFGLADNGLTEELFLHRYFRCPDARPTARRAWRSAAVEWLRDVAMNRAPGPAERFGDPDHFLRPEQGSDADGGEWLWHEGGLDRATLDRWRLLAPAGWRLPERAAVLEGRPAPILDEGFRLG